MTKLDALVSLLKDHRVVIQTHNFPDPDAVASAFALQYLLKVKGIEATCCYFGVIDKLNLKMMISELGIEIFHESEIVNSESDYVITIDGQKNNANFTDLTGTEIACIDHHSWVTTYNYAMVDHKTYGACATIIYEYFVENQIPIPANVATALLYAIRMDTMNFSRGITENDLMAFFSLNKLADNNMLLKFESNELQLSDLQAYGAAINNISVIKNLGFAHIPFDCPDGLIAMVASFILSLDSVEIAVIYADRDEGLKMSVRSEIDGLNAGFLTHKALEGIGDGGGHPTMAGGVVFPDSKKRLGLNLDTEIQQRFCDALESLY